MQRPQRETMHPQQCMVHCSNVGHANIQTQYPVLGQGLSFQSDSSSARKIKADASPKLKKLESSNRKRKNEERGRAEKKASGESSKEKSSTRTDFIHVRARRGQATDSHSLAERVRRERISERMKRLQELVPACSAAMGKASMLDEIINYVQSLQKQVEFLSRKLAAVDPGMQHYSSSHFFDGELNAACNYSSILVHGVPLSDHHFDLSGLQSKSMQPANACSDLNMAMDPIELVLQRTMSAPVTLPTTFLDSSFDDHSASWDAAAFISLIHGVEFQQGSEPALPSQSPHGAEQFSESTTSCLAHQLIGSI